MNGYSFYTIYSSQIVVEVLECLYETNHNVLLGSRTQVFDFDLRKIAINEIND